MSSGSEVLKSKKNRWVATLFNYDDGDVRRIRQTLDSKNCEYVLGRETCPSTGKEHLQICARFPNGVVGKTFKAMIGDDAQVDVMKKDFEKNKEYCKKDGNYEEDNSDEIRRQMVMDFIYKDTQWRPFQQDVIDYCTDVKYDPRQIFWIYDEIGNIGKSYLVDYLCLKFGALKAQGKSNDVHFVISEYVNKHKSDPHLPPLLIDIPRADFRKVNWSLVEEVKSSSMMSGKYRSQCVCYIPPPVFIFSNAPPDMSKLSLDRWRIFRATENSYEEETDIFLEQENGSI